MEKSNKNNTTVQVVLVAVIIILLIAVAVLYLNSNNSKNTQQLAPIQNTSAANKTLSALKANYSNLLNNLTTLKSNYSSLKTQYTLLQSQKNQTVNNSVQIVKQVLYSQKTLTLQPPSYNYNGYNYVTGCYWIGGYYNFSFYAPYSGYIVFNETNTGIPANFSTVYFSAIFSGEKPWYDTVSSYNTSSWCTGETVTSNIAPWTQVTPYNNQTMIIPVKNGTNYVILYNDNANEKHGVNPFAINVTFSMTYYGFKGTNIPAAPNTTTATPNSISWGKFGGN